MSQLTLIALYGQKDSVLEKTINECHKIISAVPKIRYHPYDIRQIHATIISLERLDSTRLNKYFSTYRNQQKVMDFGRLLRYLRKNEDLKFQVQIGGFFQQGYPFTSMGKKPYERSFQISQDKVIMIGWPISGSQKQHDIYNVGQDAENYPLTLDNIRRAFQNFNILHRYHIRPTDVDNDFYFRIGILDPDSISDNWREKVENDIRMYLSSINPIIVNVENIMLARYENEELPLDSTQTWPFSDREITEEFLWSLYN